MRLLANGIPHLIIFLIVQFPMLVYDGEGAHSIQKKADAHAPSASIDVLRHNASSKPREHCITFSF